MSENINNRIVTIAEDDSAIVFHDKTGEIEILVPKHLDKKDYMPISALIVVNLVQKLGDPEWVAKNLLDNLNGPNSINTSVETKR